MNWTSNLDKQFVIPILLGISLTTVSCVSLSMLLYSMFRKDDEIKDDEIKDDEKCDGDENSVQMIRTRSITTHYEVPNEFVSAILGRHGSVRHNIENKTGTRIRFNKKDGSPDFICIVQSNKVENICLAESMIKNILDQPSIETHEMTVLYKVCKKSGLLDRNRDIVQQIQRSSGAEIILDCAIQIKGRCKIIIKGTLGQIECAVTQLQDKFNEIKQQARMKHDREASIRMLTSSTNKNIENEIKDKIDDETESETDDEICDRYDIRRDELDDELDGKIDRKEDINKMEDFEKELRDQMDDEINNAIDDDYLNETGISKITSSSVPYKVWEEFIEKSGKTIEQIKKDFRDVEIIIEENSISPDNNKVVIKGYLVPVEQIFMQIINKIKGFEKEDEKKKFEDRVKQDIIKRNITKCDSNIQHITDNLQQRLRLFFIYKPSVPHKVWEKFIEKSGKSIEQIKQDFGDVEIIIEEDPMSPDNNKVTLQGYLTPVTEAMRQIRDVVKGLDEKKKFNKIKGPYFIRLDQRRIEVFVSAVETPNKFWIQKIGPGNVALKNLVSKMTRYYNKAENREFHKKEVQLYQIVAAKFNHDKKWYRAQVLHIENSHCKVFYVDYGDVDTIPINDVLELHKDMLNLELQALECSLEIEPRKNEWTPEACGKFADLTHVAQWKPLIARIKRPLHSRPKFDMHSRYSPRIVPLIELFEKTDDKIINIGKTLIHLELAKKNSNYKYGIQSRFFLRTESDSNIRDKASISSIFTNRF